MSNNEYDSNMDLLISEDKVTITIRDEISTETIVHIELTPEQFCSLLSRRVYVGCNAKKGRLEHIGKKMLMDKLIFEMPKHSYQERNEVARCEANKVCPKGWIPDKYYGSKNSFFEKDGKQYATTTIRRWE